MAEAPPQYIPVATLDDATRSDFMVRVYQHLLAAVVGFVAIEALLINLGVAKAMYEWLDGNGYMWLAILGGFMVGSWIATNAAHDILEPSRQYAGLFGLAALYAVLFAPMLHYVYDVQSDGSATVGAAAIITALGFAGLTAVALTTRSDLSYLRPLVLWGFVSALVLIVAAVLFGLELGVWFSLAMIGLAGGAILYQTQTILRQYPEEAYVGAAVQLFASVMTLFWYVLRLFSRR